MPPWLARAHLRNAKYWVWLPPETGGMAEGGSNKGWTIEPRVSEALSGQAYVRIVSGTGIQLHQKAAGQPAQDGFWGEGLAGSRWKLAIMLIRASGFLFRRMLVSCGFSLKPLPVWGQAPTSLICFNLQFPDR